jgi:hypothetical protein
LLSLMRGFYSEIRIEKQKNSQNLAKISVNKKLTKGGEYVARYKFCYYA